MGHLGTTSIHDKIHMVVMLMCGVDRDRSLKTWSMAVRVIDFDFEITDGLSEVHIALEQNSCSQRLRWARATTTRTSQKNGNISTGTYVGPYQSVRFGHCYKKYWCNFISHFISHFVKGWHPPSLFCFSAWWTVESCNFSNSIRKFIKSSKKSGMPYFLKIGQFNVVSKIKLDGGNQVRGGKPISMDDFPESRGKHISLCRLASGQDPHNSHHLISLRDQFFL